MQLTESIEQCSFRWIAIRNGVWAYDVERMSVVPYKAELGIGLQGCHAFVLLYGAQVA